MQFNKSYRLLRYLNRHHSWLSRHTLGGLAWLGTWLFTQSSVLAGLMRREFIRDDFRLAFRRAAWFARHIFPKLDFFEDPFFDFTMETDAAQQRQLDRFVKRYRGSLSESVYLTDMLYLQAANIHGRLDESPAGLYPHAEVVEFYNTADAALAALPVPPAADEGSFSERKDDFSKADAIAALSDFADALPLSEWGWYVVSGTFLGLHRDGGFLAHDYDIDVGIHGEQIDVDELVETLAAYPRFVTKKVDLHIEITQSDDGLLHLEKVPALVKLIHENGLNLDVFVHYTENGRCWHGSIIHRWENSPFELKRATLEGVEVNAPADADCYLTENYGDWRTPVKEFDCTTGTPNLVVSRNFLSVALFLKRLAVFSESDGKQAAKLKQTLINSGVVEESGSGLQVVRSFEKAEPLLGGG
ncbi:hypothetical protein [Marinobacter litoralis]|uniref:hypothetical protein n=1 Tax=Marinobacter litoralis TaxID=187981 RepID=UPI0018EC2E2C|nr:hypothetical protein [Marinobacter litoralis]MBJ6137354.1 hypothetical protein [Marinobacter litoralis]